MILVYAYQKYKFFKPKPVNIVVCYHIYQNSKILPKIVTYLILSFEDWDFTL